MKGDILDNIIIYPELTGMVSVWDSEVQEKLSSMIEHYKMPKSNWLGELAVIGMAGLAGLGAEQFVQQRQASQEILAKQEQIDRLESINQQLVERVDQGTPIILVDRNVGGLSLEEIAMSDFETLFEARPETMETIETLLPVYKNQFSQDVDTGIMDHLSLVSLAASIRITETDNRNPWVEQNGIMVVNPSLDYLKRHMVSNRGAVGQFQMIQEFWREYGDGTPVFTTPEYEEAKRIFESDERSQVRREVSRSRNALERYLRNGRNPNSAEYSRLSNRFQDNLMELKDLEERMDSLYGEFEQSWVEEFAGMPYHEVIENEGRLKPDGWAIALTNYFEKMCSEGKCDPKTLLVRYVSAYESAESFNFPYYEQTVNRFHDYAGILKQSYVGLSEMLPGDIERDYREQQRRDLNNIISSPDQ